MEISIPMAFKEENTMNKKLKELIDRINVVKGQITNLVNDGKLDEAKALKEGELKDLQNQFDILKDVVDNEPQDVVVTPIPVNGSAPAEGVIPVEETVDAIHDFAEAARNGFRLNMNNEGTAADGGYTVPEDIQTRINEWKEARFALERLVDHESVSTLSGRRTYKKKSQHTGFSQVNEQGKIPAKTGPQFEVITYTVKKYGGYLPVTNELLADSDANIANVLIEWLGEEDIATKNTIVLAAIAKKAAVEFTDLDGIKKAVNVTLGQAYAGTISIVTNDDGLNYLDTLKDENGRYLLQPAVDPTNPIQMSLAVGARRIPVVIVPNAILKTANKKVPFIVGDLKEYCKIFDRQHMSIIQSNIAAVGSGEGAINAFEQDLTIFRALERLDCVVKDEDAIVNGTITLGE